MADEGGDVDGSGAQGHDLLAASGSLEPVDLLVGLGDGEELGDRHPVGRDALRLLEQFVSFASVVELVGTSAHRFVQRLQRIIHDRLGEPCLADAHYGLFGQ